MNFTVVSKPEAEDELAELWVSSPNRQALSDAADRLEQLLATDPSNLGESRDGVMRIAFEKPLGVIFDVSSDDRLVTVLHFWTVD